MNEEVWLEWNGTEVRLVQADVVVVQNGLEMEGVSGDALEQVTLMSKLRLWERVILFLGIELDTCGRILGKRWPGRDDKRKVPSFLLFGQVLHLDYQQKSRRD